MAKQDLVDISSIAKELRDDKFSELFSEQLSFDEYLRHIKVNPLINRTAFQRLYDLVIRFGSEEKELFGQKVKRHKFFDDPFTNGRNAIYGMDKALEGLVLTLSAAASLTHTQKRLLLLHGPVGSAKSTIATAFKRGLEWYSRQVEGMLYTFAWKLDEEKDKEEYGIDFDFEKGGSRYQICPIRENPLHILPFELRRRVIHQLSGNGGVFKVPADFVELLPHYKHGFEIPLPADAKLCPKCDYRSERILSGDIGNMEELINNIVVVPFMLSETRKQGITTFQPKDEKNQDATELTGDINFRKIALFGEDTDPRAYNYDGELLAANRGMVEFIEVLKLETQFLYDLLTATQERVVKPKGLPHIWIDTVIIGHTNEPEYKKLKGDDKMEAFRDRMIKTDVPYNLTLTAERKIYERDLQVTPLNGKVNDDGEVLKPKIHVAPHVTEFAAWFTLLTRVKQPKNRTLTLRDKIRLYDGQHVANYTETMAEELIREAEGEGLSGVSPRFVQNCVEKAASIVLQTGERCLNPFILREAMKNSLRTDSVIDQNNIAEYDGRLNEALEELEQLCIQDVQSAASHDPNQMKAVYNQYLDNLRGYVMKKKIKSPVTKELGDPDLNFMSEIEAFMDVKQDVDSFRRVLHSTISDAMYDAGNDPEKSRDPVLERAVGRYLFEKQKATLRVERFMDEASVKAGDQETDAIIRNLVSTGYCNHCARKALQAVAAFYSREKADKKPPKK